VIYAVKNKLCQKSLAFFQKCPKILRIKFKKRLNHRLSDKRKQNNTNNTYQQLLWFYIIHSPIPYFFFDLFSEYFERMHIVAFNNLLKSIGIVIHLIDDKLRDLCIVIQE